MKAMSTKINGVQIIETDVGLQLGKNIHIDLTNLI